MRNGYQVVIPIKNDRTSNPPWNTKTFIKAFKCSVYVVPA